MPDFGEFKGENGPQSPARFISNNSDHPLALDKFTLIAGSAPSYNNLCDIDRLRNSMTHIAAGWRLNFNATPSIIIGGKHGNLCGAAVRDSSFTGSAAQKVIQGDRRAIFGGLIMANFGITGPIAEIMAGTMPDGKARFDGVIAPFLEAEAVEVLARAKGKCRIMVNPELHNSCHVLDAAPRKRYVCGGELEQPNYTYVLNFNDPDIKVFGERNVAVEKDLLLAWAIGCTSNSNTITIVVDGMLIGNGVGQQDRVGAAELAVKRAIDAGHKDRLNGAAAYSDSFFPFPDAVRVLINAGIRAIFSTSGSVNDQVIQDLCIKSGVTLYQLPDSKARGFFGH